MLERIKAESVFELDCWKNGRSFFTDGIQFARIDTQRVENGRRYLGSAYGGSDRLGTESRIRQQQDHIDVVMREPTVLLLFVLAAGVSHADIWSHDDIRRTGIFVWIVVV